jgi:hypothetical protein
MFSDVEAYNIGMRTRERFEHSLQNIRSSPLNASEVTTDRSNWDRKGIYSRVDNLPLQCRELIRCHSSWLVLLVELVLESMVLKPPQPVF